MVQSVSTYSQAILSATYSGTFLSSSFTGKEKDSESGYHYFGARYYDSEALTGWLSVDPMMDKYPSFSPYNYCAWNPIKLVDPDGRKFLILNAKTEFLEKKLKNMKKIAKDFVLLNPR